VAVTCLVLLGAGLHLRGGLLADDGRDVAAGFVGVAGEELTAQRGRSGLSFRLQRPAAHGLLSLFVLVDKQQQYVSLCSWDYQQASRERMTETEAKAAGAAFLRAKSPFYREDRPVELLVQGGPHAPRYVISQDVPDEQVTYLIRVETDGSRRPLVYGVAEWPREPAAVSPTKLTEEQALAIVSEAVARDPDLVLDRIWIVSLGTRTFFAPDGKPVYVVRMDVRRRTAPGSPVPFWPESFDWGVHATTGELFTEMTMLPPPPPLPKGAPEVGEASQEGAANTK
jgi:hypothetical protein